MTSTAAPPRIFSRKRRIAGLRRARVRQSQRDAARYVLGDMVEDVLDRLEFMRLAPRRVLVIGDWTGTLALSLGGKGALVEERDVATLDEERPVAGDPFDLIVSLSSLDRVNDLPGALLHLRNALADAGIVIASVIGAGSLPNLRRAMIAAEPDRPVARMHPLIDNRAASALLQRALFKRQVVDARTLSVAYGALDRLVSDLRDQGLGNVLASPAPPLGKAALARARTAFLDRADRNRRVLENFEILTLTGWKD
jgi:SAM-dependent methyltransferase